MKNFVTAAREASSGPKSVPFTLTSSDGENQDEYTALPPTEEMVGVFSAAFATDADEKDRMGALLDFLRGSVTRTDFQHIRSRLLDRNDELGFELLVDVVGWIMEQFSDFPTQPFSDSTPSRPGTGPRSTGRSRSAASSRSITARAASAT